jgi:hypothetical protein
MNFFVLLMLLQEGNPCQIPLETVTDPRAIYALSDQWGDPSMITSVEVIIVLNGFDEPIERFRIAPSGFSTTGFMGCGRANFQPPDRLLRDGSTVYALSMRFENGARMVSPWSNSALFVLSAPTSQPPRAPAVRLGRTEDEAVNDER